MNTAKVKNWFLMKYNPRIYSSPEENICDYFALPAENQVCLFGNTYNDSRADEKTGSFFDGNRIITGDLTSFTIRQAITPRTVYTLLDIHPQYADWLKEQGYDVETAGIIHYASKESDAHDTIYSMSRF
jgi:hypothetical protein